MSPAVESVERTGTWMHGYTKHACGCTHIFNWRTHTYTLRNVYASKPLQVYSCVFPSWVEATFHRLFYSKRSHRDLTCFLCLQRNSFLFLTLVMFTCTSKMCSSKSDGINSRHAKKFCTTGGGWKTDGYYEFINSRRWRVKLLQRKNILNYSCILACVVYCSAKLPMKQIN